MPGFGWVTPEQAANLFSEEGSGGFAPPSFSSTEPGLRLQAQLDADAAAATFGYNQKLEQMRQQFEAEQEQKRLEAERLAKLEDLKAQRQATFVDMIGRDPVRAVMFALGLGPEADVFKTQFTGLQGTMPELASAKQSESETEAALRGLSTKYGAGTATADIGAKGVTGLGSAEQSARALSWGGLDVQKLLGSAFGVGSTTTGGLSLDELLRRAQQVTPKGVLP